MNTETDDQFDIIGVDIGTSRVRVIGVGKTQRNAEAYMEMAVMRRGVDDEFFVVVPAGMYNDGDKYRPNVAGPSR